MTFTFRKAVRRQAKLRLAISGPSGSGKTLGALIIAKALGGRTAVIDSEHGSADLYAGKPEVPEFESLSLTAPYTPERYIAAIEAAEQAGFDNIITDSITHEWKGSGGILEIVDGLTQTKYRGNSYAAWGEADPRHRKFIDKMLASRCHIIATMRSKTAYVEGERNGRKTYMKAGMQPEQRDGMEYEFTLVLDVAHEGHIALASKDRTGLFRDPRIIDATTGKLLLDWLNSAEAQAEPEPPQQSAAVTQQPGYKERKAKALEACETRDALRLEWGSIGADCRESKDRATYDELIKVRDRCAASLSPAGAEAGAETEEAGA
jgi:hypothetical protein